MEYFRYHFTNKRYIEKHVFDNLDTVIGDVTVTEGRANPTTLNVHSKIVFWNPHSKNTQEQPQLSLSSFFLTAKQTDEAGDQDEPWARFAPAAEMKTLVRINQETVASASDKRNHFFW